MSLDESLVRAALAALQDPISGFELVSARSLKTLSVNRSTGDVSIQVTLGYPARSAWPELERLMSAALAGLPGMGRLAVGFSTEVVAHAVQRGVPLLPGVRNIVAVASGKGGVGKSTTTANLALALAAEGARVGILDADIYGPSQPTMMGVSGQPESLDGQSIEPMRAHGLQVMSIGFFGA